MDADEGVLFGVWFAGHQSEMEGTDREVTVRHQMKRPPRSIDLALEVSLHQRFIPASVLDEIGDGANLQLVLGGELNEVGQARHRAVVTHDLAQYRRGRKPREPRQVAAGFGVPG